MGAARRALDRRVGLCEFWWCAIAADKFYSFQQVCLSQLDQRGTKADDKPSLQEQHFQMLDRDSASARDRDKTLQALRYDGLDRSSTRTSEKRSATIEIVIFFECLRLAREYPMYLNDRSARASSNALKQFVTDFHRFRGKYLLDQKRASNFQHCVPTEGATL